LTRLERIGNVQSTTTTARARIIEALAILRKALASRGGQLPWPINRTPSFPRDFDWATVPEGYQWPGIDWSKHPEALAVKDACRTVHEALQNGKPVLLDETIAPRALLVEIARFVSQDVGEDLESLPAPPSMLRKLDELIEDLGGKSKQPANVPTFNIKTGVLTIGEIAYTPTTSERHVLRVLVERQTATLPELEQAAARPDRVLKGLLKKYPALKKRITLPGRAGHGGYSTTIEPARTSP
jgi:hypothetical protein